ncbi:MAG: hypothetical protein FJ096_21670, partial [Deltaproteobacteria bacterium]|nr:hypothetical protein [Deltaproteobacteria bacterium]
ERPYRDTVPGHVVGDILKNAQPGTLPLQACTNAKASPSITVHTTKAPPKDFTCNRVMGHVPQTQLPGTVPMHRWYHRGERRYVLTTDPNFDGPGNGYSDVVLEGYVFQRN